MKRSAMAGMALALVIVAMLSERGQANPEVDTVKWVGPVNGGAWNDASAWKNITTNTVGDATTLFLTNRGSEGMNNIDPALTAARHIFIGGGATVDFAITLTQTSGLRLRKGTSLTVAGGATWVQDITGLPDGSGWFECRCDPSDLIIDGGTFRRAGEGTEETAPGSGIFVNVGGGQILFASYNDDNNTPRLGTLPPTVNVVLKNGGRIENTGQMWFGTDGESSPETRAHMTINNGHLDLTGGGIPIENGEMTDLGGVVGDLAFFYDWSENLALANPLRAHNEEFVVNFTGPGSIKVDATGIRVLRQPAPTDPTDPLTASDWTGRDTQVSYLDLWNAGILQANGLSGKTGTRFGDGTTPHTLQPADFNNFFTVTGNPGDIDYTLTAKPATTIATIEWVGGASGEWNDANAWRNNTTSAVGNATTLLLTNRGSEGMNNIDPAVTAARHIVIGGGTTVDYDVLTLGGFRLRKGTTLTIKQGATWVQDITDHPDGNGWAECRCDPSDLIIDGGTFRRVGEGTEETAPGSGIFVNVGGGQILFASYNDDNNTPRLGTLPPRVNVALKNGGRIENTGQMWFGTDGESSPETRVHMTINNGHMDLTGGGIPIENGEMTDLGGVVGDLAFFYDWSENLALANPLRAHNEEFVVNFTGPGSITVDEAGIRILRQPAPTDPTDPLTASDWTGRDVQVSYLDLWNAGILQANGLSGKTGTRFGDGTTPHTLQPADFADFFMVTNNPGDANYTLTSLITAPIQGDHNGDGVVDLADHVWWRRFDGSQQGYDDWVANFGFPPGSGSGSSNSAVPEPASLTMLLLGMLAMLHRRRAA